MLNKFLRPIFLFPFLAVLLSLLWLGMGLRPVREQSGFQYTTFGELPVLHAGRIKPLDTVARTALLLLSGKQTLKSGEKNRISAIEWLTAVMFSPEKSYAYKAFRIDNPEVLGMLGLEQGSSPFFDFNVISPHLEELQRQAMRAGQIADGKRSAFEAAVLKLHNQLSLYFRLQNTVHASSSSDIAQKLGVLEEKMAAVAREDPARRLSAEALLAELKPVLSSFEVVQEAADFRPVPLIKDGLRSDNWLTTAESLRQTLRTGKVDPVLLSWAGLSDAYRAGNVESFNAETGRLKERLQELDGKSIFQSHYEAVFNHFEPFYKSMALYLLVLLFCFAYWLLKNETLNATGYALFMTAFLLHSAGLLSRMVLQGRPPVTNLYSSAVFVGWGAALLGVFLESRKRTSMVSAMASAVGFVTLIIAHHLSLQGDTMEMMRAVLDSNFWLATHVVTITIGYSSTFIAGAIGMLYLLRRAFDRGFSPEAAGELEKVLYGLLCFSAFFNFIGTVLGGIWADQSWGRFWGWDPKENGALLIVLWIIFILHARAGRLISAKTLMALAVFGNIVTALAWFGVNMLNIGLHSYGSMDKGFSWLVIFSLSQILIMGMAALPERRLVLNRKP